MRKRLQWLAALLAVAMTVAACGSSGEGGSGNGADPTGPPQHGGKLTVLEDAGYSGSWPTGLDPATNTTGGANLSQMSAIYGGLFLLTADNDGSNAKVVPNQAAGYKVLDGGKTVRIKIRKGITFADGTPFNAKAVAFNFRRDVKSSCSCAPTWPLADNGITVKDPHTVVLHFTRPNAAVIHNFPVSNVNWIVSPTALKKKGTDKFKIKPVGAGPFVVVSDKLSSELVLKRNPTYFKDSLPYLDRLTFKSIGGDQPAYQALLAGQGQAYEGLSTTPLLLQAKSNPKLTVTVQPATSPYVVQLNTKTAPFNNKKAREAIYYATNFKAIAKGIFKGLYKTSQSFTAPGGLFYHPTVPGYRTHNLKKAKQLVHELGGLKVTMGTLDSYVAKQVMTALQTEWKKAGIQVDIKSYQLSTLVQQFNSAKWQAMLQTAGAWDPAVGVGVSFRFESNAPFSGVHDPELDKILNQAAATLEKGERDKLYQQAAKYISDHAYAPFGLAFAPASLATKGVYGPGLTTKIPTLAVNPGILWGKVWTTA